MRDLIEKEASSLSYEILCIEQEWFVGEKRLANIIKDKSRQVLINKGIIFKDINVTVSEHNKMFSFCSSDKKKISFTSVDKKVKGSVLIPERSHGKEYDKYKLFMKNLILAQVA